MTNQKVSEVVTDERPRPTGEESGPHDANSDSGSLWLRKVKNHAIVAIVSVVATVTIMSGNVADALSHIRQFMHPEKTPIELVRQNAKSDFSRRLIQNAWERMFWMRSYAFRLQRSAPQTDIDYAWNKYIDATVEWNRNLMVNYEGLEEYYPGTDKGAVFLSDVQDGFTRAGNELGELRYPQRSSPKGPQSGDPKNIEPYAKLDAPALQHLASFNDTIDSLNRNLFIFVTTQDEKALTRRHP